MSKGPWKKKERRGRQAVTGITEGPKTGIAEADLLEYIERTSTQSEESSKKPGQTERRQKAEAELIEYIRKQNTELVDKLDEPVNYRVNKVALPEGLQAGFLGKLQDKITSPTVLATKLPLYEWSMQMRRFDGMPPSIPFPIADIYRDEASEVIIMKAAQVYISEFGINTVLWAADQKWADRGVCLYVFPKQVHMDDFSQARVGKAINESPYLKRRLQQLNRFDNSNRVRLRRIANAPIYFRGSDSVAQTRAVDADVVIADEIDLWMEGAYDRAKERLGSSLRPLVRAFSQPQYPDGPIDRLYQESDQRHYYLTCEHCSEEQLLDWNENISFPLDYSDCRVVCKKCKRPIDRLAEGRWIAHNSQSRVHGYHISKLYSPRANLLDILQKSIAVHDPERIQSFYNADLGIPYRPVGSPGLEEFYKGVWPWAQALKENYIGIDVGKKLHLVVFGRDYLSDPMRLLYCTAVDDFAEVEKIWWHYEPRLGIIDAQGDPRATLEWSSKHHGRVYRWLHKPSALEAKYTGDEVHYHRTSLLDLLYGVLRSHRAHLHATAGPEFYSHLEANIREIVKDPRDGRLTPRYLPTKADHYAFAAAFALLAAGVAPGPAQMTLVRRSEITPLVIDHPDEVPVSTRKAMWTGSGGQKWARWK